MTKSLVAFDTDRIKSYVFCTPSLKEIRGASAILDQLNREEMAAVVKGEQIYANGGSGLFIVDTVAADSVISAVQHLYQTATHSATITGASVDIPSGRVNLHDELALLRHRLRANKTSKRKVTTPVSHPFLKFCSLCGSSHSKTEVDGAFLCESCEAKRRADMQVKHQIETWIKGATPDSTHLWGRLVRDLSANDYPMTGRNRPEDFGQLGNISSPSGYMALLYADGDSIGNELDNINNIDDLRRFSEAVDSSIYDAVADAICTHLQPEHNTVLPFDILLLGGDDLVMVVTADRALEVAAHVVERFTQLTMERWGHPLRLSISVTFSHVNYPIGSLIHLAEGSLKHAKREAAKRRLDGLSNVDGGLINFLVVSSSNHLDYGRFFRQTLRSEERNEVFVRTCRPYSVKELRDLLITVRSMRSTPRNKLEQLRSAVFKSRRQGNIDAMMVVLRLRNREQREQILSLFGNSVQDQVFLPWRQENARWVTPVLDVVELLDFVR